jgi:hypothetical protein
LSAGVVVGRALLALLGGRDAGMPALASLDELVEHAAGGGAVPDDDVLAHAWWRILPARVQAAVDADAVDVPLADGTTLARDAAERLLAQKEERRVYPPLRLPLERAVARAVRDDDTRPALLRAVPEALRPALGTLPGDDDVASLRTFLAHTAGAAEASRDLLARVGGAPLDGGADRAAALRRGLDLPAPAWFGSEAVSAAVRLALSTSTPVRPAARTTAPRALAGHVVDDGVTPRLLVAPCASAGRHLALAQGAGAVLAAAFAVDAHAPGLALALVDPAMLRGLDRGRDEAAQAFRVTVATALLWARARAAVAVAGAERCESDGEDAEEERRERARSGVRAALLGDPGQAFVDALRAPPWPDGRRLRAPAVAAVDVARRAVRMARSWTTLREALDEGFVTRRGALATLRELPVADDADADARGWRALLDEVL